MRHYIDRDGELVAERPSGEGSLVYPDGTISVQRAPMDLWELHCGPLVLLPDLAANAAEEEQ